MNVPIEGRGDSALIITSYADTPLIGFVAQTELRGFFRTDPSMCECMSFVRDHLEQKQSTAPNLSTMKPGD